MRYGESWWELFTHLGPIMAPFQALEDHRRQYSIVVKALALGVRSSGFEFWLCYQGVIDLGWLWESYLTTLRLSQSLSLTCLFFHRSIWFIKSTLCCQNDFYQPLWGLVSLRASTVSSFVIWPGNIAPSFSHALFLLPSPPSTISSTSLDFSKSPEELLALGFWFFVLQELVKISGRRNYNT